MRPDPTILAFDTSAAHCAAALLSADRIVASEVRDMAKGQAETLMPMLDGILKGAGVDWTDLDALGVGVGPGNFTGIRISVAAARGVALGLGVPAVGVSTLDALAEGAQGPGLALCDARRGALYLQGFGGVDEPARHVSAGDVEEVLGNYPSVPMIADGPVTLPVPYQSAAPALPLPDAIARIAARQAASNAPAPAPLYLRPADAAPARPAPTLLSE